MKDSIFQTTLRGGQRVWKDDLRLEACGTVDELNAWIGVLRESLSSHPESLSLLRIQQTLLIIGSILAGADRGEGPSALSPLDGEIQWLEGLIRETAKELPPLSRFVLPGEGRLDGFIHVARTVCRRAERRIVSLIRTKSPTDIEQNPVDLSLIHYINGLSRYLFLLAYKWLHQPRAHG